MKCIICLQEQPESSEHIFPAAIGGTLKIDRVCARCNSRLGHTADLSLTNHPLVMLAAARCLNNPELSARLLGTGVFQNDHMKDVAAYLVSSMDGPLEIRNVPKVERSEDRSTLRAIFGSEKTGNAKSVLKSFLAEHGQHLSATEFESFFGQNVKPIVDSHPETKHSFVVTREQLHSRTFGHGMVKIAYEFAWRSLGDAWLDDDIAVKMRIALEDWPTGGEGLTGRYSVLRQEEVQFADHLGARQADTLAVGLMIAGRRIVVALHVFDIISSILDVSEQGERYSWPQPRDPYGFAVIIDVAKATHRELTAGEAVSEWIAEKNETSPD